MKVRVNLHGNFLVVSASLSKKEEAAIEEQEATEAPNMDTDDKKVN